MPALPEEIPLLPIVKKQSLALLGGNLGVSPSSCSRNVIDVNREENLEQMTQKIAALQEKEKVFPDEFSIKPEKILERMDELIKPIIRAKMVVVFELDHNFWELLCHAFFRRTHDDEEREVYASTKEPLYSLLVAAYVSNSMRRIITDRCEEFEANRVYFENCACKLFDEMYNDNHVKLEYHVLAKDYEKKFRVYEYSRDPDLTLFQRQVKERQGQSRELMCVAYRGECMKFLSHIACQKYIKARWEKGNVSYLFINLISAQIDYLFEPGKDEALYTTQQTTAPSEISALTSSQQGDGVSSSAASETSPPQESFCVRCERSLQKSCVQCCNDFQQSCCFQYNRKYVKAVWDFLWKPQTKYFFHAVVSIVFVFAFSMVLIQKPWLSRFEDYRWYSVVVFIFVAVTLIIDFFEHTYKFIAIGLIYGRVFWWDSFAFRTLRYVAQMLLGTTTFLFLVLPPSQPVSLQLVELFFSICFIISTLSMLKYLSFFTFFGGKIELIKVMASSILRYMLILCVFWLIYATCYLSLTDGWRRTNGTIIWEIFSHGSFEIVGESNEDDQKGKLNNCSDINLYNMNWTLPEDVGCFVQSTFIPPMLLVYMLIATVMLINVFTAMLSHEYEKRQEMAKAYINYHRYDMLIRFETKFILPAPFSILSLMFHLVYSCYNSSRRFSNCCCNCESSKFVSLITKVENFGCGPDKLEGLVNIFAIPILMQRVLKKRVSHSFLKDCKDFLKQWENKHNYDGPKGIDEAQEILNGIIGKFTAYLTSESQAAQSSVNDARQEAAMVRHETISEIVLRSRNVSGKHGMASRTSTLQGVEFADQTVVGRLQGAVETLTSIAIHPPNPSSPTSSSVDS